MRGFALRLRERLQEAAQLARDGGTGLADALTPDAADKRHRPLFQSVTIGQGSMVHPEHRFWAETALWLSAGLADFGPDQPRAAHTLVGAGWVGDQLLTDDFVFEDKDGPKDNKHATVRTAEAHAKSWGLETLSDVAAHVYPAPPTPSEGRPPAQHQLLALDISGTLPRSSRAVRPLPRR